MGQCQKDACCVFIMDIMLIMLYYHGLEMQALFWGPNKPVLNIFLWMLDFRYVWDKFQRHEFLSQTFLYNQIFIVFIILNCTLL